MEMIQGHIKVVTPHGTGLMLGSEGHVMRADARAVDSMWCRADARVGVGTGTV